MPFTACAGSRTRSKGRRVSGSERVERDDPSPGQFVGEAPTHRTLVPSYLRDCQKLISGPFSSNVSDINLAGDYNRIGGNHGDSQQKNICRGGGADTRASGRSFGSHSNSGSEPL